MLRTLRISNYALIEKLDIDFSSGFSVLTGETGAGKSIILGALGLLLGDRADLRLIKKGAQKCYVEGIFDVTSLDIRPFFEENEIEFDGCECIIRRELYSNGKSRSFINDTPILVSKIKCLGNKLIDIHSQHKNLLLSNDNFLIEFIDAVGHLGSLLADYKNAYHLWNQKKEELLQLKEKSEKGKSDYDYLKFQLGQIHDAHLEIDEQNLLEAEYKQLSHAEEIKSVFYQVVSYLTADDSNPSRWIRQHVQSLENIGSVFPSSLEFSGRLESVRIELDDILDDMNRIIDDTDYDPRRLEFVDERLSLIYNLQKKFHINSIEELLAYAQQLELQLNFIENYEDKVKEIEEEVSLLYQKLLEYGKELTSRRKKVAVQILHKLTEILVMLGMPSVQLDFSFLERNHPTATGLDKPILLFSANKNVDMQDVSLIASGGEIARLMLAVKSLFAEYLKLPTIIFDEIDTGVSGHIAEKMAFVMKKMSANCQVLCITHLPQIAAEGYNHYRIYKLETSDETTSHICCLTTEDRIIEIAKMLSGSEISDTAIENAKSLLKL